MFILGIDGGGTKTIGTIARLDGMIVDSQAVGPTNPNSIGLEKAEMEIRHLMLNLKEANPQEFNQISAVFAGMSGVDREQDKEKMINIFSRFFHDSCSITVTNDAINALYSGTLGNPGVVNICGTGSITLGVDPAGNIYRVGGWGFLLEDSASGYSIGRDALIHIFAEYDGFGKKTAITQKVLSLFNISTPPDLIPTIYEGGKSRTVISSISLIVMEAANEGDEIALSILKKAGKEMAQSICRLVRKLPEAMISESPVDIVLAGSIYKQASWFLPIIEEEVIEAGFISNLIIPELPPVSGSLYTALRSVGIEINDSIKSRIKNTFKN